MKKLFFVVALVSIVGISMGSEENIRSSVVGSVVGQEQQQLYPKEMKECWDYYVNPDGTITRVPCPN